MSIPFRGEQKELMGLQDTLMQRLIPVIQEGQAEGTFDQTFTAPALRGIFTPRCPLASQKHAFEQQATDEEISATIRRLYLKIVFAQP